MSVKGFRFGLPDIQGRPLWGYEGSGGQGSQVRGD